jgi:type IV pilus assembly protein PilC
MPVFEKIYRANNINITGIMLSLITLTTLIKANFGFFCTFILSIIIFSFAFIKNSFLKIQLTSTLFNIPIISVFFKQYYTLKTLIAIKLALNIGLSLTRAYQVSADTVKNHLFELTLLKAQEALSKHEQASPFLAKSKLFTPTVLQILSIAELMNSTKDVLDELIPYLKEEFESNSKVLSSFIEPMILILGGIIIGVTLSSFLMPVLHLIKKAGI